MTIRKIPAIHRRIAEYHALATSCIARRTQMNTIHNEISLNATSKVDCPPSIGRATGLDIGGGNVTYGQIGGCTGYIQKRIQIVARRTIRSNILNSYPGSPPLDGKVDIPIIGQGKIPDGDIVGVNG